MQPIQPLPLEFHPDPSINPGCQTTPAVQFVIKNTPFGIDVRKTWHRIRNAAICMSIPEIKMQTEKEEKKIGPSIKRGNPKDKET